MRHARAFSIFFSIFILTVLFAGTTPLGAQTEQREWQRQIEPIPEGDEVPLKNWVVPLPVATVSGEGKISAMALPSGASHFIAITPCRVVDTRNPAGSFGGPAFAPGGTRTFNVPGGPCAGIPVAAAYSLNFTIVNYDASNGFLTAFPTGAARPFVSTVNFGFGTNTNAVANAAVVPASDAGSIDVFSSGATNLIIDINGFFSAGDLVLSGNLTLPASSSTAGAIRQGGSQLLHTFGGNGSVFLGPNAGNFTMVNAFRNTVVGESSLVSNTGGDDNVAIGSLVLPNNTSGNLNTAIGRVALLNNTTGGNNIAVGVGAGQNLTTGSLNIDIGNAGVAGESSTIRVGTSGNQTRAFVAGVRDVTTGVVDGLMVLIDSAGQLGTVSSSARVKRDITGMGEQSSDLMKLRPVSFFYRSDAVGIRQYGLIAEEVAEVMPELVQFSPAGEAETVRYHFLAPLLLNEIQKQQQTIDEQRETNDQQRKQITIIEARLTTHQRIEELLEARLAALETQSRDSNAGDKIAK